MLLDNGTLEQGVKCSKLTMKTLERRHWRHFGVFNVDFELISHLFLMFLLLTLTGNSNLWFLQGF